MLDLDAGAYAAFVWPSYAITAAVFVGMVWYSLARARRWRRRAEEERRERR
ncbi:MAG: heme exporter protein CcmD [Phenylobacterium sp.]|jgi:heme exporter protein D|uniref:heme exporter protein CcmD n=1 Tax=Phenylobacterium sp. TaxID=1871053 RepID=UPI00391B9BD3